VIVVYWLFKRGVSDVQLMSHNLRVIARVWCLVTVMPLYRSFVNLPGLSQFLNSQQNSLKVQRLYRKSKGHLLARISFLRRDPLL